MTANPYAAPQAGGDAVAAPYVGSGDRAAQLEALAYLGQQTSRVHTRVTAVLAVIGLLAGIPLYWLATVLSNELLDFYSPILNGLLAYAPPVMGVLRLGPVLTKRIVTARRPDWIEEAAIRFDVSAEFLRQAGEPVL